MRRLVDFIHTYPAVARCVEQLNVFYSRGDYRSYMVVIFLCPLLTNLRSLTFSTFPWVTIRPIFFATVTKLKALTDLRIQTVRFMSSRDFTKFIMALSSLRHLHVSDITSVNRRSYTPPSKTRRTLPLLSLDLSTPVANLDILSTFCVTSSNKDITYAKIFVEKTHLPTPPLEVIGNFLGGCVSLRHLELHTNIPGLTADGQ